MTAPTLLSAEELNSALQDIVLSVAHDDIKGHFAALAARIAELSLYSDAIDECRKACRAISPDVMAFVDDDVAQCLLVAKERAEKAAEALKLYGQHSDSCGDHDSYNNIPLAEQTCGCGLNAAIAAADGRDRG